MINVSIPDSGRFGALKACDPSTEWGHFVVRLNISVLLAASAIALATPAAAATYVPGVTVTGNPLTLGNPPFTLGYAFTTTTTFSVGGLGVYDAGSDGLASRHDVGLWDAGGALLASTIVGAGTSGTLVDGFRFNTFAAFNIGPGSYRVGALFLDGNDPLFFPGSGTVTSIAGLTYTGGAYAAGSTLADPTTVNAADSPGYIGGNVLLTAVDSAVPEPSTWAMMILGFGLIAGTMRSRQSRAKVRFAF